MGPYIIIAGVVGLAVIVVLADWLACRRSEDAERIHTRREGGRNERVRGL